MGALPARRQAAAMTDAAVRADVHQALDVHRDLGAQGTFNAIGLLDLLAETVHVRVREILDALVGADPGRRDDAARGLATDAVDVGKADLDLFLPREIDAGYACHGYPCR